VTESERIEQGKTIRREVLGAAHVDRPGPTPTKLQAAFRDFTIEHCWANVWVRPGLSRRDRSVLNLGMLAAMARWHEFEVHVRGAINNGLTDDEFVEIILQVGVYAGVPVAAEAFRVADKVLAEHGRGQA
jgi:4-carboxymuconolactone decarboxylase